MSDANQAVAQGVQGAQTAQAPQGVPWYNPRATVTLDGAQVPISEVYVNLRQSARNMENNAYPEGHSADDLKMKLVDVPFQSVHEMLVRYYGHIMNNQGESAMLSARKSHKGEEEFDRTQALFAWREGKKREILEANLGVRKAPAVRVVTDKTEQLMRELVFEQLVAFAAKTGQTGFPTKMTNRALTTVIDTAPDGTDISVDDMIEKILESPAGPGYRGKAEKLIAEREAAINEGAPQGASWKDTLAALQQAAG